MAVIHLQQQHVCVWTYVWMCICVCLYMHSSLESATQMGNRVIVKIFMKFK